MAIRKIIWHDIAKCCSNIQRIIDLYPENYCENGVLFWKGCKKFPSVLKLDIKDSITFEFILSYTKIYCNILKIPYNEEEIKTKIYTNSIKTLGQIKTNTYNNIQKVHGEIITFITKIDNKAISIKPEKFEKDKDEHINFIYACSNLRARNYKIEECDKFRAKYISGNIIPALSTTTACITGFSAMQIFTLLNYKKDRNRLNEINFNLAINSFQIHKPLKVENHIDIKTNKRAIIAIPKNFTNWDHIQINGPMKIKNFIKNMKNEYNVIVKGIYLPVTKCAIIISEETLEDSFEIAYSKIMKRDIKLVRRIIPFEIDGKDESKNSVIMPIFVYRF